MQKTGEAREAGITEMENEIMQERLNTGACCQHLFQ